MGQINLSDSDGRDAMVNMQHVHAPRRVRWLDDSGRQVTHVRVLKSTIDQDIERLVSENGDIDKVTQMMLDEDPEVDMEQVGSILSEVSRVFINPDQEIVHRVNKFEVIREPDGTVRERRPRKVYQPNVATEVPLKWSGKLIKKSVAIRRFVFVNKMQIMHVNGLTYDFLFEMAKRLEVADSLMLLGGGGKSNQPLVLRRGTSPHRGFLEGRTQGDRYCLTLHFANMELKDPSKDKKDRDGEGEEAQDN